MNRSTPDLPVHHQLLEFTQTHVHWVDDAIQLSHPLSSPSPPALNLSQHQGLFKWVSSSHQVAKVLDFQLQHQCRRPGFSSCVGKTPGEGKGYPLHYSGLENTVHGVTKSQTPQLYSLNFPLKLNICVCIHTHTHTHTHTHKIQESESPLE